MVARMVCWRAGALRKAGEQRLRREQPGACGGQLDGQRQSIQADADLGNGMGIG